MSFEENLESIQKVLKRRGYQNIRRYVDISKLTRDESVHDCEIIARKDQYNILYMEAMSNWRGIATDVAKNQLSPCLVITGYKESYLILSTIKDPVTAPKPRHIIIEKSSKNHSFEEFAGLIKVTQDDDVDSIDKHVQKAFDKFSAYKEALNEFAENLKGAIENTRDMIEKASDKNSRYDEESSKFLEMSRAIISNDLQSKDVTEMLLQHVLTYEIFSMIYDEHELHSTNAVARSLEGMVGILEINMERVSAGYQTIKLVAESIIDSAEKQDFLKLVYETFYAAYDPKNKDKYGIVYTPSEVVDFMVRSTNELLEKHFKKSISDNCVTVLDPATGTGTFVTSILRYLDQDSLQRKYEKDIFANDISLLAYYIAALNIENTYQEITNEIKEFENICWMDTLATGTKDFGKVSTYFESQDNVKRITNQQTKDICVVLGNPPYNSSQVSFNDANPADKYPDIDAKIAETYVRQSTVGLKNRQYDMYKRFLKWASNRIRNNGMVVFISNNSFLDAKSDDGFRKSVYDEFDYIYAVDLKGDARLSGEAWRREGGKIFGSSARVGIAISFFIKTGEGKSEIHYSEVNNYMTRESKLNWLGDNSLSTLQTRQIIPDTDANWLNQTNNDFDELVPITNDEYCIFESLSTGLASNRDEWVYDLDRTSLETKIKYFIKFYNKTLEEYRKEKPTDDIKDWVKKKIKWSADILKHLKQNKKLTYWEEKTRSALYRPFVLKFNYFDKMVIERYGKFLNIFRDNKPNKLISFPNPATNLLFHTLATDKIIDYGCMASTQCIPLYVYGNDELHSNVTEFGLNLFRKHYKNNTISDEDIFYYTYAIFNDPEYLKKYMFNLQRKFPRIPLAENFAQWIKIGKKLYDLHVDFEKAEPYPLKRIDVKTNKNSIKLNLKRSDEQEPSKIIVDDQTTLEGIPDTALTYMFRSKCALEWILEFYKESKNMIGDKSSDDPKIREKFNTYKFADHKEHVIDLLQRVTTVSVETMKLRSELEKMPWGEQPKWKPKKSVTSKKTKTNKKPNKKRAGLQAKLDGSKQKRLF